LTNNLWIDDTVANLYREIEMLMLMRRGRGMGRVVAMRERMGMTHRGRVSMIS
jgi:hypothetical protein